MGFTSSTFCFVFLPISIILFLFVNRLFHNSKANNIFLVILSLIFYIWCSKESFVFFLVTTLLTYFAGISVATGKSENEKRIIIPIILLSGILVFYKYISLCALAINAIVGKQLLEIQDLVAPLALSFVIFEAISYVVDIYRGDAEPGSLLDCFTFMSLFPKLISGPIVLWKDIQKQLNISNISIDKIATGIERIIIGYAKKVILADTFGTQIQLINMSIATGGVDVQTMWLRTVLYFFQIYYDFSGYSDIAIGLCNLFGYEIKPNFDYPYLSTSVTEFWRRWHISLGTWFREYVYIPLGGNRKGNVYIHLAIVFILTGMWHGMGLQFLVWGGIHGIAVILERLINRKKWYKSIPTLVKWIATTLFVLLAWVFFMSGDLTKAIQTFTGMFIAASPEKINFTWQYYLSRRIVILLIIAIVIQLTGIEKIRKKLRLLTDIPLANTIKTILLCGLLVIDILFIVNTSYSPFIYFQF